FTTYVDGNRNLWIETDRLGVAKFNPYTRRYLHFSPYIESTETTVFPPNFFIFEDKEGRLWVHPRGGGFSYYNRDLDQLLPFYNGTQLRSIHMNVNLHSTRFNDVRPIFEDSRGMIWAATKDGIIHLFDNSLQEKGILTEKGIIGKGRPLKGIAYCFMEDSRHN